jgi:hypothetical protein
MGSDSWQVLDQVSGAGRAAILKGLLEAQGIEVILSQEGIGETIYPLSVGPLSEIQILVREDQIEEAKRIIADYSAGGFENLSYQDSSDAHLDEPDLGNNKSQDQG